MTDADIEAPLQFYKEARAEGDFDAGIEMALRAVLASTEFLFRIERDPRSVTPQTPYRVSDVELASRLSFFLWSSVPDDELLDLATAGTLNRPATLEQQVKRMLASPKAEALVTNFAGQWLYLRNLAAASPDARTFPDFDDNLRQAFRRETELFVESIMHGGPQRPRSASRELHVRERAAGQALRDSQRVRQPLPARHARGRTACAADSSVRAAS